jgi:hypothetical protein
MDDPATSHSAADTDTLFAEGYDRAVKLLTNCATVDGFLASPTDSANYRRIWARDGVVIGLAALLTGYHDLGEALKHTLQTLARYQGPHGEIPSNVDPVSQRVSYGGTTGRVDSDLWFVIGCGEYWHATGDEEFLEQILPAIEKVRFLLGAWEFNNRGLLYVPQAGDWADEYLRTGYVLYDQLLYLQVYRTLCKLHEQVHGSSDHLLAEKVAHLKHLICDNYWFAENGDEPVDMYHEVLFNKGRKAAPHRIGKQPYWMPSFSSSGYSYRFDAFANVLASLFDVANDEQRNTVDKFINDICHDDMPVLPAFHPVIQQMDKDWKELKVMFSYTFRNKPYEFHNGGLWPMLTGFYVADLARRGKMKEARRYLQGIHTANALEMEGEEWGFPEFVHGKKLTPGGTYRQGWSAAATVIGHHALQGEQVFGLNEE